MLKHILISLSAASLIALPAAAEAKKSDHSKAYKKALKKARYVSGYSGRYHRPSYSGRRYVRISPYHASRVYRTRYYGSSIYASPYYSSGYYSSPYYSSGYYGAPYAYGNGYRNRYYRNRYARCGSGTTGAIVGGLAGAAIGSQIAGGNYYRRGDRTTGALVGGAVGALIGHQVARRC
jgi:Glycine zipper 2TM domain